MKITHGACGKTWTGANRSHCPACCETFNSETAADKHRKGTFGIDRHCVPPAEVGLIAVEHPWGLCWQTPRSDDRWPARGEPEAA